MTALIAIVAGVAGAYFATPVLLPTVCGLLMAILVHPVDARLRSWRLGRAASASFAVLAALVATLLFGWACWHATAKVIEDVPQYSGKIRHAVRGLEEKVRHLETKTQTLVQEHPAVQPQQQAQPAPSSRPSEWTGTLLRGLGSLAEAAALAVFVPFLALLLLIERQTLERALDRAAGPRFDAARLRAEVPPMVRAFVFGNFIVGCVLAGLQTGLFLALGLDNAVGLGIVTGFFNVIPVIGLPVALILPIAQGLGKFESPWPFVVLIVAIKLLHIGVANWVEPRTIGRRVKVNGAASTLGMLFFYWLWGVVGFVLAIPLTALVKIALECSEDGKRYAGLLAAEPAQGASKTK